MFKGLSAAVVAVLTTGVAWVAASGAQTPTPKTDRLTARQVLDDWVTNTEKIVVVAADALPENQYAYAPIEGAFRGVRSFAEQVKHLSAANYQLGARILGEQPPAGTKNEEAPDSVKSKSDVMEYLKGSFECLHRAATSINEKNAVDPVAGTSGTWQRTRLGLLIDALAHSSNHYGQMVEYLRMNGIVPPASRPKNAPQTVAASASPRSESPFACDRAAMTPTERKRHFEELGPALRTLKRKARELPDGFEFEFPADRKTFQLVTEWVAGERLCCPFFDIDVRLEREAGPLRLRLTGREGAKQFIEAEAGWLEK